MRTIGLVGGVASGKSLAAKILVDLGAGLLDADRTGHAVLADNAEVHEKLRQRWGDAIFSTEGTVDRAALARLVFANRSRADADREFLEEILHPRIRRRLETLRDQFAAEGKPAVVLDAPLLFESGWNSMCDILVMIDSDRALRLERARARGWNDAEFAKREAAQWPIDKKRLAADVIISNNGTADDLRREVEAFWQNDLPPGQSVA